MFLHMYLGVGIFSFHISCCICYVNYDQFQGFDHKEITSSSRPPADKTTSPEPETLNGRYSIPWVISSAIIPEVLSSTGNSTTPSTASTASEASPSTRPPVLPVVLPKFNCSEDERPFNIGTYEVPTQRDLVLQIQRTLTRMFSVYQEKALDLLQDIQQATKATSGIEKKCQVDGNHNYRRDYRSCVKEVSKKCEYITKSLITSLELQRADVSAFIEGTICNVTEMRADPVQMIKTLAMEQASLEFALPGFLRLLGSCSAYCDITHPKMKHKKPLRHMTDQDLVVKHFLTKKTYIQLIN